MFSAWWRRASYHATSPALPNKRCVLPLGMVNLISRSVTDTDIMAGNPSMGAFSPGPNLARNTRTFSFSNSSVKCLGSATNGSSAGRPASGVAMEFLLTRPSVEGLKDKTPLSRIQAAGRETGERRRIRAPRGLVSQIPPQPTSLQKNVFHSCHSAPSADGEESRSEKTSSQREPGSEDRPSADGSAASQSELHSYNPNMCNIHRALILQARRDKPISISKKRPAKRGHSGRIRHDDEDCYRRNADRRIGGPR